MNFENSALKPDGAFDVAVIGGGPGGSTAATLLAREGFRVVLFERERFPRFQIGESLLPYNNDLFSRLGLLEKLREGTFVPKFGAGFVTGDGSLAFNFRFRDHLSPFHGQAFQVKRETFDQLLLQNAEAAGVVVRQETTVTDVDLSDPSRATLSTLDRAGNRSSTSVRFVVDASGHTGVIGSRLGLRQEEASLRKLAIFAHHRNVVPAGEDELAGYIIVVVIRNGWFWMIPLSDGVTSVGLVIERDAFLKSGLTPEEMLAQTIAATPYVAGRMANAERVSQVYTRKDFSFRMKRFVAPNFALVGDAAGFIDPIFSTGVLMAMKSADRATAGITSLLRSGSVKLLNDYQRAMRKSLDRYLKLIAHFYRREFLEVFLQPDERWGILRAVVRLLAGNVFDHSPDRWKITLLFAMVRLQRIRPVIAHPIAWDRLPAAARATSPEESFAQSH